MKEKTGLVSVRVKLADEIDKIVIEMMLDSKFNLEKLLPKLDEKKINSELVKSVNGAVDKISEKFYFPF